VADSKTDKKANKKTTAKTVFVTGASGFIAKHIVLQLLEAGHYVRGSVRSEAKADRVRQTMAAHLSDPEAQSKRLEFVTLDLTQDDGWDQALSGSDVLMHTASPFPMVQPKDENDLIRPAVDGSLRALKAAKAAGVGRVILTSSVAAVSYQNPMPDKAQMTEDNWTDVKGPAASAYSRSKTLAERAAWDFVAQHPELVMTTINPGMVLGPALDQHFGTSLALVERVLKGKDPALPRLMFDVVDVRDVARMHIDAMSTQASEGQRLISSGGPMWFADIARTLKDAYPDRKITTRLAPDWFIRLYALVDPAVRQITPLLGKEVSSSNARAQQVLGMTFTTPKQALLESARYLIDNKLVR